MAARRKRTPAFNLDPKNDHGPVLLLRRGLVVREDRPDPEATNRTVTGARRRDGLRQMHARKHLTDAEWVAAERFRDDMAYASGARLMTDNAGVRSTVVSYGPSCLQVDALSRVRGATQAVGIVLNPLLMWVVVGHGTLEDYASCNRIRPGRAGELLHTVLGRLADFYATAK